MAVGHSCEVNLRDIIDTTRCCSYDKPVSPQHPFNVGLALGDLAMDG